MSQGAGRSMRKLRTQCQQLGTYILVFMSRHALKLQVSIQFQKKNSLSFMDLTLALENNPVRDTKHARWFLDVLTRNKFYGCPGEEF